MALTEPNGLLAIGGDLTPQRLINAYYQGIFPWFNNHDPILWWSPDPRAVLTPGTINISRSLAKFIKKCRWRFTINHAFNEVIAACAAPRTYQNDTWITETIQQAYIRLHHKHWAHSIEVWEEDKLIGGLYGVAMGHIFCGESMFHRKSNASKMAFLLLEQHLISYGYQLIDAQIMNPHLASLGAKSIRRVEFMEHLHKLRDQQIAPRAWDKAEVTLER